jgi:MFS family permease
MYLAGRPAYQVLRLPDFRHFLASRFLLVLSIQMVSVAVGWQIYELTRDPLSLGFIGLAEALAFFSVALFGGHFADTHDRQRTVAVSSALLFGCTTVLLWLSWGGQRHLDKTTLPIYGVVAAIGLVRAFLAPATMALGAQIVPRELYARMSAYNSLVFQIGAVGGPAAAGLIYGFFGVRAAYGTALAFGLLGFSAAALIRSYGVPGSSGNQLSMASLSQGLKFVFRHPVVLPAMSLDMFAVLFGGATAILPMVAGAVARLAPSLRRLDLSRQG